jgi:hypothetical protein
MACRPEAESFQPTADSQRLKARGGLFIDRFLGFEL